MLAVEQTGVMCTFTPEARRVRIAGQHAIGRGQARVGTTAGWLDWVTAAAPGQVTGSASVWPRIDLAQQSLIEERGCH
jgi:hypothetical protein